MAQPFVSRDGVDPQGVRAEVFVQTGTGTVKNLIENGNNVQVQMNVEGLKHPVQGWTSKSENIYPMLVEAKDQGREIAYRIESQRKRGIDRTIPIETLRENMDVAKENCRNLFVGVDGTLSSEAVTDPAEDPYAGGRIPATDPRNKPKPEAAPAATGGGFSAEQALTGLANARKGGLPNTIVDAAAALALAAGATVEQVLSAGVEEQEAPAPRPVQRAIAKEAAPFVAYNTDGRPNLGSYMVQAAVGAESLAADLLAAHAEAVAERHNAAVAAGEIEGEPVTVEPVDFKQAAALGAVLLELADYVQVGTIGAGRPDRMATSHTRARGYVYDAVKHRYPVPLGQGAEAQDAWKQQVIEEATTRFKWAVRIAVGEPTAPAEQPAQDHQAPQSQQPQQQNSQEQASEQATSQEHAAGDQIGAETAGGTSGEAAGEVRQIGNAQAQAQRVPVEGDERFEAPSPEILQRFGALASSAGFEPTPNSPVTAYLNSKFGVTAARKVHGEALAKLVAWYEQKGEAGAAMFAEHVRAETRPANIA